MSEKIKAIVVRSVDKKEKDKSILLFSIEQGRIWATLKGVKNPTAKMKQAQIPFTFGEFILEDSKAGKVVVGFEPIENFKEFSEDVDKYFSGMAILEVLNIMDVSSASERANLMVLSLRAMKSICFGKANPIYCLDKYFIQLFASSGVPLFTDKCQSCGSKSFDFLHVNYLTGELVCAACKDFNCEQLSKPTYMALKILNNTDWEKLASVKLAKDSEIGLLRVLVRNFESRFDTKLKLIGILS